MYEGIVQDLIDELGRLPGIGPKSAQRIAFHILTTESFDVTHLVTCLHGYAKVYKHQVVPGEAAVADGILDIRGGNQGAGYRGNGLVSLFQDEVALCGDGFLRRGIYKFGFELEFPARSLPSSIDVSWILLVACSR